MPELMLRNSTTVQRVKPKSKQQEFRWKDKHNNFWKVKNMETRHLFFTLRMIWNHSMPEHMHVGGTTNRYSFGPFYTVQYMADAVRNIVPELESRTDMRADWKRQLAQMKAWVAAGATPQSQLRAHEQEDEDLDDDVAFYEDDF